MSVSLKRIPIKNITDEYIRENIDEILEIMLYITNDNHKKGNWKRALKKDGASKNITYLGYAALHMICKKTERMSETIEELVFLRKEAFNESD